MSASLSPHELDDELERFFDDEYASKYAHVDDILRVKSQQRTRLPCGKSKSCVSPAAHTSSPQLVTPPLCRSWSRSSSSEMSPVARIQKNIEELERKIAAAAITLSSAERRASQRKWIQQRQSQRHRRSLEPRTSTSDASPASSTANDSATLEVGNDSDDGLPSELQEASPLAATAPTQKVSGLQLVMRRLSSWDPCEALRLASVTQPLWHAASSLEFKRRTDAAVLLQRHQRGRMARYETKQLCLARQQMVAEFLEQYPEFERKRRPDASGVGNTIANAKARILPQLTSGARLGTGAFGVVYRPRRAWHFPREGIAVKAVSLRSTEAANAAASEAALLRRLQQTVGCHPNVVTLHDWFLIGEHARLALDFADHGDLYEHLWRNRGQLTRGAALNFSRQLIAGLVHLHRAGIAHRDLKLANALLFAGRCPGGGVSGGGDGDGDHNPGLTLKIGDLGMSIHESELPSMDSFLVTQGAPERARLEGHIGGSCGARGVSNEAVGTSTTMAPEIFELAPSASITASASGLQQCYCPFAADSWSLGICMLTLLAPREFDEFEFDRTSFYPFVQAWSELDEDYAAFAECASMLSARAPLPSWLPTSFAPRSTALPMPPPGLGTRPPGLVTEDNLLVAPQTRASSAVLSLLERRALLYGMALPDPPLPSRVLRLLDGLLTPHPGARLSAPAAAQLLSCVSEDV